MEIREGIRYEYYTNKYATCVESISEKGKFYANFDDGGTSGSYTKASWVKDFKSGSIKLVEYPYKVGDWVFDINEKFVKSYKTPRIVQITDIQKDRVYVNNEEQCVHMNVFNNDYRPCFKDEIPGKIVKPKKKKKEDYSYLVDLFRERGIT